MLLNEIIKEVGMTKPKIKLLEVPKTNFKKFTFQTLIILILVILK